MDSILTVSYFSKTILNIKNQNYILIVESHTVG